MYRTITILLLLFSLAVCSTGFAQPECYTKYKKRGDDAMRIKKWENAIKHYEAARRCDIDSAKYQEEIERLIDSTYKLWVRELEAAKKESNDFISFLTVNFADENCKKGKYNEAFSFLQIGDNNNFDKIVSYRNILLPYLSDKDLENVVKIKLFSKGNSSFAAVLEKEPQRAAPKKAKQVSNDFTDQPDQSRSEKADDTEAEKKENVRLRLNFYDISGPVVKQISSLTDIIDLEEDIYLERTGDEILLMTANKIHFFEIQPPSIIKRGEITYNNVPPITTLYSYMPDIYSGYKKINIKLLEENLFASFSQLNYDSLTSKRITSFTLKIQNHKTGDNILKIDSILDFQYFPDLQKMAIIKNADSLRLLIYDLRTRSQTFVPGKILYYTLPASGYQVSLTIPIDTATSLPPLRTTLSARLLSAKSRVVYYNMKTGLITDGAPPTQTYVDGASTVYLTKIKNGYYSYAYQTGLTILDTARKKKTFFKVSTFAYLADRDKLILVNFGSNINNPNSRDTLKIIDPERRDSIVYIAEKISLFTGDSLFIVSDKAGMTIFHYANQDRLDSIQFPNKKLIYASYMMPGYFNIQAENINAKKNDTVSFIYSLKTKASIYEMPGKTEKLDMIGYPSKTRVCFSTTTRNIGQQRIFIFDTATRKVEALTLNIHRDLLDEITYVHYYPSKNLFILCRELSYDDYNSDELTVVSETRPDILKRPTSQILVYNLSTGLMETIHTMLEIDQNILDVEGNYIVLTGFTNLLQFDEEVKSCYFYNLHLFGKERVDHYKKMHRTSIESFKKKVYAGDKTE